MKYLKITVIGIVLAAVTTPIIYSCKKGPGDPFLSLRSRKARVTGEWIIDYFLREYNFQSSSGSGSDVSTSSGTDKEEVTGGGLSFKSTSGYLYQGSSSSYSATGSGGATAKMTLGKDGTFKRTIIYNNIVLTQMTSYGTGTATNSYTTTMTGNMSNESSGTWNFLGGVEKDYKNKERIVLNILSESMTSSFSQDGETETSTETSAYANGEYAEIWTLNTLKDDEIIIEGEINNSGNYVYSSVFSGTTITNPSTQSTKGKLAATLTK